MDYTQGQGSVWAVLVVALGLATACTDRPAPKVQASEQPASAAAGVPGDTQVGVTPAGPGKETPGTTSAAKSDVSKGEESAAMPLPGQANDHSTLAPNAAKKTGDSNR